MFSEVNFGDIVLCSSTTQNNEEKLQPRNVYMRLLSSLFSVNSSVIFETYVQFQVKPTIRLLVVSIFNSKGTMNANTYNTLT